MTRHIIIKVQSRQDGKTLPLILNETGHQGLQQIYRKTVKDRKVNIWSRPHIPRHPFATYFYNNMLTCGAFNLYWELCDSYTCKTRSCNFR